MNENQVEQFLNEIEELLENNFDIVELEKKVNTGAQKMDKIWDILRLGSLLRWASYDDESKGEILCSNIVDKAIEKAMALKSIDDLKTIAYELEYSMELDDKADEVRKSILKIKK
jgi:hypothetical protein